MSDQRLEVHPGDRGSPRPPLFAVLYEHPGDVAVAASDMLLSADGSPAAAVADHFAARIDRDSLRHYGRGENDVTVVVSAFGAGQEIAWTIEGVMQAIIEHVSGDRTRLIEGDARVTSYCDWFDVHEMYHWSVADALPTTLGKNLRAALGIQARTAVTGTLHPGGKGTAKGGAAACRAGQ